MGARLQNRYELGEPVEALDAGVWHRGEDVRSRRAVRIALLAKDAPAERVAAFERAARLSAKVRHPGVERVVASGRDPEGRAFVVVEPMVGAPLSARLLEEPAVKLHDLLRSITSVLNGLDIAHKAGLVHGGIEPGRVLVDDKLRAQLGGFALNGATAAAPSPELVAWLAPEVLAGAEPTAAADVYGMGAILYRAFVGEPPKIGAGLSLRERRRILPASLAEAVDKAVAPAPADRPQSAGDLRKELTAAMVGAQGLRTMVVPKRAERPDDTLESIENLSLADLEEPTPRELRAWTKPKSSSPPPIPRELSRANQRAKKGPVTRTAPAAAPWKRSPPPLVSPANAIANARASRPSAPSPRASGVPTVSAGAQSVAKSARPAPSPSPAAAARSAPPKPAAAIGRVKLVTAAVPRPKATPRVVEEVDATSIALESIEEVAAAIPAESPAPVATMPAPIPVESAPAEATARDADTEPPPPMPAVAARAEVDDDEPELEAADDDDVSDDDASDGPWAEAPRPWPYPTGGPPGLVLPHRPASRPGAGLVPAFAVGTLVLGIVMAGAGALRLVKDPGGGALADSVATGESARSAWVPRPRRRATEPRRSETPAPPIATPVSATPEAVTPPAAPPVVAAPEVAPPAAPAPVAVTPAPTVDDADDAPASEPRRPSTTRRRPRPTASPRPAAPTSMASTMSGGRTLVRDPGF